jgi:hypothetical protein
MLLLLSSLSLQDPLFTFPQKVPNKPAVLDPIATILPGPCFFSSVLLPNFAFSGRAGRRDSAFGVANRLLEGYR